jgi:hypothetical protein
VRQSNIKLDELTDTHFRWIGEDQRNVTVWETKAVRMKKNTTNPLSAAHPVVLPLQLGSVASEFLVESQ